ncbi:hypothetical protein [Granulicella rosea]|uniref:hypothetical protein n=1 Tax=Granulicella rosea TaxID=474952 RepID=UPI000B7937BA|nr:hypothetical protein [Granulicella rosea]
MKSSTPLTATELEGSNENSVALGESQRLAIAWSSLFFAFLQNVCAALIALNGVRVAIGLGSLVMTGFAGTLVVRLHAAHIRHAMLALSFAGALLNMGILAQAHYLRRRPASQWRIQPLSRRAIRMQWLQLGLSIATLLLIALETSIHFRQHGHI